MSLIGHAYLLPEAKIQALLQNPADVFGVIDGAYNAPEHGFVDLDKAWHCLHYLLSGSAQAGEGPLAFLLAGGTPVGDEDLGGAGPARVFGPPEVSVIAGALAEVSETTLLERLEVKKLEALGIYPGRWDHLNLKSDYELGYYFGPFRGLQRLTLRARDEGLGMILWIS
ncbi:MAG: DUF1877 family protein [Myxococcales bacterium]|nr:MAG: DUF1877 family protein [Myxococcales bacterium]